MTNATRVLAALALTAACAAAVPAPSDGSPRRAPITATCDGKKATIVGTNGNDTLRGTAKNDVIVGKGGDDVIRGGGGNDIICGQDGRDMLYGGPGDDKLFGGTNGAVSTTDGTKLEGDFLQGGPGDDLLDVGADARSNAPGGRDLDVIDYSTSSVGVKIDLSTKAAGQGNGTVTGPGDDTIVLRRFTAIQGSQHDDTFMGSPLRDTFYGNAGDDTISGGPGDDTLYADIISPSHRPADDDVVDGGPGNDVIYSDAGIDVLSGGGGADTIGSNSQLPATITGGDGPDTIYSRITRQSGYVLDGGRGIDKATVVTPTVLNGSPVALVVVDEALNDVDAYFGHHSAGQMTSIENLTVTGELALDFYGTDADETLSGDGTHRIRAWMAGGNDTVTGSNLGDYLNGGPGKDTAYAGAGADSCPGIEKKHSCP